MKKEKELEKEAVKCHCEDDKCNDKDCHCEDSECKCDDESCGCEGHECDEECHCEGEHDHEHGKDEECDCGHDHHHEEHDHRYEYIVALEKDLKEAEDKVLRAKAEMINYRKRMEEEQVKIFKYASEDVIKNVLPIIDNFERAIALDDSNLNDELSKFLLGFKMVYGDLEKLLKKYDVKEIDALNKAFDPMYHEAVATEKVEGIATGVVVAVLQKGYMLNDKVLRPAMVKVNE